MNNTTDTAWVHRQAALAIQFECQDEGRIVELEYTNILGKLPRALPKGHAVGDAEVWIVCCQLTDNVDNAGYWWPVQEYLAVYKRLDGTPISRHATSAEVAVFPASPDEEEDRVPPCSMPSAEGPQSVGEDDEDDI